MESRRILVAEVVLSPLCQRTSGVGRDVNHVFVLGDNRDASHDSRHWGALPVAKLEGRVVFVYFSFDSRPSAAPRSALGRIRWERIGMRVRS